MDEIAVGIGLVLFGYAAYSALKTPSDFSSQVVVNPRQRAEPSPPPAKAPAAKKEAKEAKEAAPAPAVKAPPKAAPPAAPVAKAPPPVVVAEPPAKVETVVAEAPVEAAAAAETPAAEPAAEAQEAPRTVVMLKNPATGEIAPLPADYRFAKKWIKDALVSEGLLDRIYKNSELDRKNRTRIREALERLKAMPKYGV